MSTYTRLTREQFEERIIQDIERLKARINKERERKTLATYLSSNPYSSLKGNIEKLLDYLDGRGVASKYYSFDLKKALYEYNELIESAEREVYGPGLEKRTREMFNRISLERRIKYTKKQDERLKRVFKRNDSLKK